MTFRIAMAAIGLACGFVLHAHAQPMAGLSEVELLLIKESCLEAEYAYAEGLDVEDPDLFASAFAPDATMTVRRGVYSNANDGMRKYLIGRNERKKAAGDYKTTHVIANPGTRSQSCGRRDVGSSI